MEMLSPSGLVRLLMDAGTILAIAIPVALVLIVVIAVVAWWISTSNRLKREQIKIDESASGIDVALTKRFDLLTKAVATVKGYAKHEEKTLDEGKG